MSLRTATCAFAALATLVPLGGLPFAQGGAPARPPAQQKEIPRTAEGRPDLEGFWVYAAATPLERPPQFEGQSFFATAAEADAFRTESEASRRAVVASRLGVPEFVEPDRPFITIDGRKPTSVIYDPPEGRIPYLSAAQQRLLAERYHSPEDIPLSERCLRALSSVPMLPTAGQPYVQLFQTGDYVALVGESLPDARLVPLDGRPHVSDRIGNWLGDSRGRWDGDTLILETLRFRDQRHQRPPYHRFSRNLRVVERFSLVASGALWYEFTVDDPTIFSRAWSGRFPMRRTQGEIFESACHEGNHAMFNILRGARAQDGAGQR